MVDRKQVVRLRRRCFTCDRIASVVGCTSQHVFQILKKDFPGHTQWVREKVQAAADKLRSRHPELSQPEVARRVRAKLGLRYSVAVAPAVPPYLLHQARILELHCQGLIQSDIALCLNLRQQLVSRSLRAAGIRGARSQLGACPAPEGEPPDCGGSMPGTQ